MDQPTVSSSVALVVGVTGITGLSMVESLKKSNCPGAPWTVYGVARRPLPSWFRSSLLDCFIQLDAVDPDATREALSPVCTSITHVFWVALAIHNSEEVNIATNSTMLTNVLSTLMDNPSSPLRHVSIQTGTKHYIGPLNDPAQQVRLAANIELPFSEDAPRLSSPQFYYSLEDIVASHTTKFSWSVHRSSIILGASPRSIHNFLLTLVVYALICKRERRPFLFPRSEYNWEHFCDASDARLLAEQQIWAATMPAAKNQAFNCTNGDVFTWKRLWRVLCEEMDVEFLHTLHGCGDWAQRMKEKGAVWDAIVEDKGLYKTNLEEVACFDAFFIVVNFQFQHVCSMNKSREFGFVGSADSLKSVRGWIRTMREMNIIPSRDINMLWIRTMREINIIPADSLKSVRGWIHSPSAIYVNKLWLKYH